MVRIWRHIPQACYLPAQAIPRAYAAGGMVRGVVRRSAQGIWKRNAECGICTQRGRGKCGRVAVAGGRAAASPRRRRRSAPSAARFETDGRLREGVTLPRQTSLFKQFTPTKHRNATVIQPASFRPPRTMSKVGLAQCARQPAIWQRVHRQTRGSRMHTTSRSRASRKR